MKTRKIYLVRHGAIYAGDKKCFVGQSDLPLAAAGIVQAERLRDRLKNLSLEMIVCSNLLRSLTTAEIIAASHFLQPVVCADLGEINLGDWEGCGFKEIRDNYPNEFAKRGADIAGYRPPGGESFGDLSKRVMAAFNALINEVAGNFLIVGHSGVNRVIISCLLGIPLKNIFSICQDYACLNIIFQDESRYRLQLMNGTEHLSNPG